MDSVRAHHSRDRRNDKHTATTIADSCNINERTRSKMRNSGRPQSCHLDTRNTAIADKSRDA